MSSYIRTPQIRQRNRDNAVSGPGRPRCKPGCMCGVHTRSGSKSCPPQCQCGKHVHTQQHNQLIGAGVARTAKKKRDINGQT